MIGSIDPWPSGITRFDYHKAMPTPWGKADRKTFIAAGVWNVSTPSHGGVLVGRKVARTLLSAAAVKVGYPWGSYVAFEEDCDWAAFAYEQPALWAIAMNPQYAEPRSPEQWKEIAEACLHRWNAAYFITA